MKQVRKSVLLWYRPAEMFDLVADVRRYPQFLPWCDSVQVLQEAGGTGTAAAPGSITARLGLAIAGLRQSFTTRNTLTRPSHLTMSLVDGPFSQLEGDWRFEPIGGAAEGSASGAAADALQSPDVAPQACRVSLDLRYAFSSGALQMVVSPVFDKIADSLVDAFVKRAEQAYGAR